MKKVESNKLQKKNTLLQTAFDLFTDKGFAKTTIADIVSQAGLAKGTFYLYFKDKYDLRDKLISKKASQLFAEAYISLQTKPDRGFEGQLIAIVDYLLEKFQKDHTLLQFLAKNLSWGIYKNAFESTISENSDNFYSFYIEQLNKSGYVCQEPELMLFTIIELVGSTCHSCILYSQPVSMEKYLPYLHQSIHQIFQSFTRLSGEEIEQTEERCTTCRLKKSENIANAVLKIG